MVLCPVPWRGQYFVSYSFIRNIHQPTQATLKLLAPWYFVLYTISSNFCQLLLNEQNIHPWAIFLVWERMMIQIRVFCGQSSVRWLLLLPNITCPLYFTNWEREMVQLMISRSDQTVFIDPNFFCTVLSESALLWHFCQYMLFWCWYAIFNLVSVRNFYCSCYLCYESQWGSLKTSEQLNLSNCSQNI